MLSNPNSFVPRHPNPLPPLPALQVVLHPRSGLPRMTSRQGRLGKSVRTGSAFAAESQAIWRPPATLKQQPPALPAHLGNDLQVRGLDPSSTPPDRPFASTGPSTPTAARPIVASSSTSVPFVTPQTTVPTLVPTDPRRVVTPLDADRLESELVKLGIQDKWMHVIDGIRYGFDVGIKEQFSHSVIHPNHASSSLDMNFISSYIKSEVGAGRYAGPFTQAGLEALIGSFCTSPLGLVPKGSSSFRLIQDLSFPRNASSVASINSQINSDDFPTAWGTFDITSSLILSLPEGCMAATFDISAAYRITPVQPDQQWALVVHWKDKFFMDHTLPFGLASSAGIFGWVADLLVDLYVHSGQFGPLVKWVDDFFTVHLPHQSWTETDFTSHTAMFGVPWSLKKLRALNIIQRYIGFDWDLTT